MIRALIFDCFGVLITDALQQIRSELMREDPEAAREVSDIVAANNRGLMEPAESSRQIAALMGITIGDLRDRIGRGEERNEALFAQISLYRASYKTALLSNIAGSSLTRRFPAGELEKYFDLVAASAEIGHAKPDREAYLYVSDRLGVLPEECIFIDDKASFCAAAEAEGMHSIVYEDLASCTASIDRIVSGN